MLRRLIAVAILCAPCIAAADPEEAATTTLVPQGVPGVNTALSVPTAASVAAAVTPVQTGTLYTVSFNPARAVTTDYYEVLSETTVSASYDSRSLLTTLSLSASYNPFAYQGGRVTGIVDELAQQAHCGAAYMAKMCPNGDRLKIDQVLAQRKLAYDEAHDADTATVEADRANLSKISHALEQCQTADQTKEQACTRERLASEWEWVYGTWRPIVTGTLATGLYPSGRSSDPANPNQTAMLEPWQGVATNLQLDFRPAERVTLQLYGSYKNTRASGAARTRRANSEGGGATMQWLAWPFRSGTKLRADDAYVARGFIPGIGLGVSFQALRCDGGPSCDSGKVRDYSLTPFIDVRLKEEVQVRLAFPIERYMSVSMPSGNAIAPTLTLAASLGKAPGFH